MVTDEISNKANMETNTKIEGWKKVDDNHQPKLK